MDQVALENWETLVRLERRNLRDMDAHLRRRTGFTLDQYDALHQLVESGEPQRMSDLAERLVVANSSCHRIVSSLADAGLVERTTGTTDRREVLVDVTADGRRQHRRLAAIHTRDIQRLVADRLSTADHEELARLLGRLAEAD